jgi:hypothetical protein
MQQVSEFVKVKEGSMRIVPLVRMFQVVPFGFGCMQKLYVFLSQVQR